MYLTVKNLRNRFTPSNPVLQEQRGHYLTGFSLIELLVVIAIIGILSAVVLASLSAARNNGANAAVKSNLSSLRAQAEIYFDDPTLGNGSYSPPPNYFGATAINCVAASSGTIFGNTKIQQLLVAAQAAGGGTARCIALPQGGPVTSYVIQVALKAPEGTGSSALTVWCVDSSGASKGSTAAQTFNIGASLTTCP
jgi:prepilin-type N-terminal cleavage/methylation domain-containing protein